LQTLKTESFPKGAVRQLVKVVKTLYNGAIELIIFAISKAEKTMFNEDDFRGTAVSDVKTCVSEEAPPEIAAETAAPPGKRRLSIGKLKNSDAAAAATAKRMCNTEGAIFDSFLGRVRNTDDILPGETSEGSSP